MYKEGTLYIGVSGDLECIKRVSFSKELSGDLESIKGVSFR